MAHRTAELPDDTGLLTTETITAGTGATASCQSVARPSAARQRRAQPDGADTDGDGAQEIIWARRPSPATYEEMLDRPRPRRHAPRRRSASLAARAGGVHGSRERSLPGYDVHDASTCEIIVKGTATSADPTNGVADDIFRTIQVQRCGARGTRLSCRLRTVPLSAPSPTRPTFSLLDADESRELEDAPPSPSTAAARCSIAPSVRRTTAAKPPDVDRRPTGDWREEIVWREADNSGLRLYTTTT